MTCRPVKPDDRLTELFVFYRDGHPYHYHQNRAVFERWLTDSPWLYPPERCEIVRFVPSTRDETPK